jgi:[protein-PII] uridylyltransferase
MVKLGVLSAKEAARFAKAENFLWTVRCHLHYIAGRAEDRLTFDLQEELGRLMGYTDHAGARGVERFMKHYFLYAKEVGDLTRIFCAALEEQHKRKPLLSLPRLGLRKRNVEGFRVRGNWVTVESDTAFADDPVNLIRLFHVAQRHHFDIHPQALRLITRNLKLIDDDLRNDAEANRLFMEILAAPDDPEFMLRRMNEAGVFGRFIPDFGRVVAQMQHDMYHVYTVDEHTIFALGILHRIELGLLDDEVPFASEVMQKVKSRRALYLALLLHDIAKGRGGSHSEIGSEIALRLGPRLRLTDEETETVSWLVRHHLLMSEIAFKRDIDDAQTVRDFVAAVQSPERLRLLLSLTVADIRAVGPNVWNGWKGALLRDLYYLSEDLMSGGLMAEGREERAAAARQALKTELSDWNAAEIEDHFARGYPAYWLAFDAQTHARQARLIREAEKSGAPLTIDTRVDDPRAITEVTIYTADHAGLFRQIGFRRQHRRRQDLYARQWHGHRHFLDPGRQWRGVQADREIGAFDQAYRKGAGGAARPRRGIGCPPDSVEARQGLPGSAQGHDRQRRLRLPYRDRSERQGPVRVPL